MKRKKKQPEKVCVRDRRTGKMECYVPKKPKRRGTGSTGSPGCGCGG